MQGLEQRASGLLLHPTSLPGTHGIGDLGPAAYRWVEMLVEARQRVWQVLPLGPTGYGDSPYQTHSAFGGNPLLLDMEHLARQGYIPCDALKDAPAFPADRVDYGQVIRWKLPLLLNAHERFERLAPPEEQKAFEAFCTAHDATWLHDYALFMALKEHFGGAPWDQWPAQIRQREFAALAHWSVRLAPRIMAYKFVQFLFFQQWEALKAYANGRGILILGDVPIYVAYDSADVWAHQHLFHLDGEGRPTVVAGVPPDYFSATGQLWGNPIYRWDRMADEDYRWWVERFRAVRHLVDIVRLDHFRAFQAYYEIPAGAQTATQGRWVQGPGEAFFQVIFQELGTFPIVAEDLGMITQEVEHLRRRLGFPGMKVLQFAFGGDTTNPYLPHNYDADCVVYTGTHDNDTTVGWFQSASQAERDFCLRYLGYRPEHISWALIRLAASSVARLTIFPVQDVLGLGSEARMNVPGRVEGNWQWRLPPDMIGQPALEELAMITETYGRVPR
ncbi:MAG: 4-alpha-glucanotransferase [Ardenticatenia bacterium]|nr:4-alpha-glucanotransferase [Ardenticatenia bacterium]